MLGGYNTNLSKEVFMVTASLAYYKILSQESFLRQQNASRSEGAYRFRLIDSRHVDIYNSRRQPLQLTQF